MHRSVIWNAVQPEHLIEAEAEQNLQNGLLCAAFGALADEPIECSLPADNTEREFLDQPPISRGQRRASQLFFEDFLDKLLPQRVSLQDGDGNFSWFLAAHSIIMSIAQLHARTYIIK